ncbi:MAG TPA: bifunctional ornithine acetyltransferase/N-acetylglutamate synthase, partial [Clostridia bacterium]|nr:bifunctional ornithine acetyltransferase/N-acetylglutamate synthase [Clostridia bacterium]
RPNLATMLCFLTTDAAISKDALDKALRNAVDRSFNMIAVDNDTSTNDMVLIMANGTAQNPLIEYGTDRYEIFEKYLTDVCVYLAKWLVRDGEGATKFIEVRVRGAADYQDAKSAAFAIACSDLVKTAMFGEDPNWGRIVAAIGYSDAFVDPDKIGVSIGPVRIVENGVSVGYREESAKEALSGKDVSIVVDLNVGPAEAVVWTCDLSYDYVRINGSYRS